LSIVLTENQSTTRRRLTRRNFLLLSAGAAGVAALGADSVLLEPNRPQLVRREIALRRWPAELNGFTIALLSDFHYDPYFSIHPIQASIPIVNALRPDLIVLAGDFVSEPVLHSYARQAAQNAEPCSRILRQLQAPHGLWAVLGNHDDATDPALITEILRATQIPVLANQSVPVEANGSRFWLSGVNDVLGGDSGLQTTLARVPRDEATVLLAHEPDYADFVARHPVDLQLSGHSHGGQVRLPFLPPFYEPPLARRYIAGLYQVGPLTLYTSRGLGTVGFPVRFDCPPEITLLTLRRALNA
jgi:uncharacterized protein